MRLYTRTGDDGTTGLFGGDRVGKDHPRIEAYGTVDELNALLGLAAAACDRGRAFPSRLRDILTSVQSRLFDIGADLATPQTSDAAARHESKIVRIGDEAAAEVEAWIDEIDGGNEPLTSFVLPGGTELASRLHAARCVCRRVERRMVSLAHTAPVNEHAIVYVNRLGDLLFACARRANGDASVADVPWRAASSPD